MLEHDEGGDAFAAAASQTINPKIRYVRNIGCKLTIYAQSTRTGALEFEHRRIAEQALDAVLVAMDDVAAARKNGWAIKGGKFITPADLDKSQAQAGAVYELTFTFERGVSERTWANAIRPESTLTSGHMTSRTRVSMRGGADDDDDPNNVPASAETACGA